jgi:hypothetical protein
MKNQQLEKLFQEYISAFKRYNLRAVQACYHLPCTLHTPDKIAYLNNDVSFTEEFKDIFTVLQHANTENIIATQASYSQSIDSSLDVCIDWSFIDDKNEVFADFTAFYHVVMIEQDFKIISVVSHDLSNSIELPLKLNIAH